MRQGTITLRAALLVGLLAPLGAGAQAEGPHMEDLGYLLQVTAGSHAQVEINELAAEKAEDEAVRGLAQDLVEQYGESSAALSEIAEGYGIEPIAELDPVSERHLEELSGLSGAAFDAAYVTGQAATLYGEGWIHRRAAEHATDPAVREAAAAAVAPTEAGYEAALALALEREGELPDGPHPWDSSALVFGMDLNRAQVALGELALERSEDEAVRAFAQRMVEEHERSFSEYAGLAQERAIAPVEEPGPVGARVLGHLSSLSGAAFDREYMGSQLILHDSGYKRLEFGGNNGRDEAVAALAAQAVDWGPDHHDHAYGVAVDLDG